MAWFGNDIGGYDAQSIINGTNKMDREPHKQYVYLVYEECHGMVGVFPDEPTANAIVKNLATDYGYNVKDPCLDYKFLDDEEGGFPEVYWKRWEVGESNL